MKSEGAWFVNSEIDPRWNKTGECSVGCFDMPEPCKEWIEQCKKSFGNPPKDCKWSYCKY
jgi:hypothetical protein